MSRIIVILLLTLAISACSRVDLAYRNADKLLEHYARQTVDVNSEQRDHWRPLLANTLKHHREVELPLIIAYLDLAERVLGETDRSIGAACLLDGAELLYQRHARLAIDLTVPLFTELNADQIEHFTNYLKQQQQNSIKEHVDSNPARRKASRQKRYFFNFERWTGKLNNRQKRLIKDALERIPDITAPWLAHRKQQTDRLLEMLEVSASAVALRDYLNDWWVEGNSRPAEYQQRLNIVNEEFTMLLDALRTTLTHKQRAKLKNRLGDIRKDLASFIPPAHQQFYLPALLACASAQV